MILLSSDMQDVYRCFYVGKCNDDHGHEAVILVRYWFPIACYLGFSVSCYRLYTSIWLITYKQYYESFTSYTCSSAYLLLVLSKNWLKHLLSCGLAGSVDSYHTWILQLSVVKALSLSASSQTTHWTTVFDN